VSVVLVSTTRQDIVVPKREGGERKRQELELESAGTYCTSGVVVGIYCSFRGGSSARRLQNRFGPGWRSHSGELLLRMADRLVVASKQASK